MKVKQKRKPRKLLQQTRSIEEVVDSIPFSSTDVMQQALDLPGLFLDAGRFRVECLNKRNFVERRLDILKTMLGRAQRKKTPKPTEGAIREAVTLDPRVQKLQAKLIRVSSLENFAVLILEALRVKRGTLGIVEGVGASGQSFDKWGGAFTTESKLVQSRRKINQKLHAKYGRSKK